MGERPNLFISGQGIGEEAQRRLIREFEGKKLLIASASGRRARFAKDIGADVIEPNPNEPPTTPFRVANRKALDIIFKEVNGVAVGGSVVLAADTRTEIAGIPKGKPADSEEVRQNLALMNRGRQYESLTFPKYHVVAGTAMIAYALGPFVLIASIGHQSSLAIQLKNDATELGRSRFGDYQRCFDEFYNSPPYTALSKKPEMKDLSGGISLPVLMKMGMVMALDEIPVANNDEFYRKYMEAIFHVAISFSIPALSLARPDIRERILNWDWLRQVVDNSLTNK